MSDIADYKKRICELVGQKGFASLTKAIVSLPNVELDQLDKYFTQLQIIPRGITYWLSKTLTDMAKSSESVSLNLPATDLSLNVQKNNQNKFPGILLKNNEKLIDFDNYELPGVLTLCVIPEKTFDESNDIIEPSLNKSLQRIVNVLVQSHCFKEKNIEVKLQKNEHSSTCPDCKETITLNPDNKKLCICFKFLGKNSLHVYRDKDDNIKVSFSPKWEKENIALLLKVFQKRAEKAHE